MGEGATDQTILWLIERNLEGWEREERIGPSSVVERENDLFLLRKRGAEGRERSAVERGARGRSGRERKKSGREREEREGVDGAGQGGLEKR